MVDLSKYYPNEHSSKIIFTAKVGESIVSYMSSCYFYKGKPKSRNTKLRGQPQASLKKARTNNFSFMLFFFFFFSDRKSEITEPATNTANQ